MSDSCARFEAVLSPFVDGELSADEAAPVREHVATCEACHAIVASYERMRERLLEARSPALAPAEVSAHLERARTTGIGWRQLAAAVIVAALVPAAVAFTAPRVRAIRSCICDTVTPELDLGL